jgi:stress response protein YsnF
MNYEKIVTLYDTLDHAEAARRNLESAGFPASEISIITNKSIGLSSDRLREPGLWHRLFGKEIQQYEAAVYGRSVDAGGAVLTIRVPETEVSRATSILNAHQSVDMLKRAEQQGLVQTAPRSTAAPPPMAAAGTATRAAGVSSPEEVLSLAEEKIDVGKRVIEGGTTRIRRFVTEMPVEQQVSLHEEHARVVRRAIADPNYTRNLDWSDKVVEITETAEEPVVSKSAHVMEEVVVQREGSDHVETIRDKVRRQQVEVEKVPGKEPVGKR